MSGVGAGPHVGAIHPQRDGPMQQLRALWMTELS
jgi:hypothetical protein